MESSSIPFTRVAGSSESAAKRTPVRAHIKASHHSQTTPNNWFSDSPLSAPPASTHKPYYDPARQQATPEPSSDYDEIGIMGSPIRKFRGSTSKVSAAGHNTASRAVATGGGLDGKDERQTHKGGNDTDVHGSFRDDDYAQASEDEDNGQSTDEAGAESQDGNLDESEDEGSAAIEDGVEGVFEVEKILAKKLSKACFRCASPLTPLLELFTDLLQQKGYGPEHDTWEPQSNINAIDLVRDFERRWHAKSNGQGKHSLASQIETTSQTRSSAGPSLKRQRLNPDSLSSESLGRRMNQTRSSHQVSSGGHIPLDQLFYNEAVADSDEYLLPMATVLCEPSWQQIRTLLTRAAGKRLRTTKMVAVHPATLVILRTPSLPTEKTFAKRKKLMLAKILEEIDDCTTPLLDKMAFPTSNVFHHCVISDILVGGEGYRLAWGEGLEDGINDEFGNLLTCAMHLEETFPHKRVRVVVRRVKPNLKAACDYFGVSIVDMEGLWHELTGR